MLMEDLLKEYCFELEIRGKAKRTIETYNYNVTQFNRYLNDTYGITEIDDVAVIHLKKFIQYQCEQGHKHTYINTLIKSIRSFYNYLVDEEYTAVNAGKRVQLLKEDIEVIKTFTDDEVSRMLEVYDFKNYLNARNKVIIAMFFDTAIRMSELINLKTDYINDDNIRIYSKGGRWWYVSMSLTLRKYMNRYERIRDRYFTGKELEHNNYFLSRNGKPLSSVAIQNIVRDCGLQANVRGVIRCSPHTIRHSSIQNHLRNGLDLYSCSRIAGHSNVQITKRYLQGIEHEQILEMAQKTKHIV